MLYGLAHAGHVPLSERPLRDMSRWFDGHPLSPKVQTRQRPSPRALVVPSEARVSSNGLDLGFQIAGQEVVLRQDPVVIGLWPVLDLRWVGGSLGTARTCSTPSKPASITTTIDDIKKALGKSMPADVFF